MYKVYIKNTEGFESKKLVGEYDDIDDAYEKIDEELAKNKDIKYVLEGITGHVDNYGDLVSKVIDEN